MKLTKKQAKKLSIKKWEYFVSNDGNSDNLIKNLPELECLMGYCGYCEKYLVGNCNNCPLVINGNDCLKKNHPWEIWCNDKTKENAQKVLDLIKKS